MRVFPYYGKVENQRGWQNAIRHNFSLHKALVQTSHGIGKGCMWTIDPECEADGS